MSLLGVEAELNAPGDKVDAEVGRTDIIKPWSSWIVLILWVDPWLPDPQKCEDNWAKADGGCKRSVEKCDKLDETFLSGADSSPLIWSISFE